MRGRKLSQVPVEYPAKRARSLTPAHGDFCQGLCSSAALETRTPWRLVAPVGRYPRQPQGPEGILRTIAHAIGQYAVSNRLLGLCRMDRSIHGSRTPAPECECNVSHHPQAPPSSPIPSHRREAEPLLGEDGHYLPIVGMFVNRRFSLSRRRWERVPEGRVRAKRNGHHQRCALALTCASHERRKMSHVA